MTNLIRRTAKRLALHAISPATRRAYAGALQRLHDWLGPNNLKDSTLALYLEDLFQLGYGTSTAGQTLAAVNFHFKNLQQLSPIGPITLRTIAGYRRQEHTVKQAPPINWQQADKMADLARHDGDIGLRDATLIRVMSDGLLRPSEASNIQISDVDFHHSTILIRRSKTDQVGEGRIMHIGKPTSTLISLWMATALLISGPLFRSFNRNHEVQNGQLSTRSIYNIIKKRAAEIGLPATGHSLRVGSLQSLKATGASMLDIQKEGGWKSPSMPAYYARHQDAGEGATAKYRYGKGNQCTSKS